MGYSFAVMIALSHGVDRGCVVAAGVNSITAWLTQASDRALPDRFVAVSVTTCLDF
jgi:hypothetical protein